MISRAISHSMSGLTATFFYQGPIKASFVSLIWIFISHSVNQDPRIAAALGTFRI